MESDVTTGTESDTSDLDPGRWHGCLSGNRSSEYSEDSDEYQGYYEDGRRIPGVYDTNIDSADDSFYDHHQVQKGQKRSYEDENDIKLRQAIAQLNAPVSNNNFGRPLYAIHETASLLSESSVENSDSHSGTPVHRPVYGRYQKLTNQNSQLNSSSNQDPEDSDSDSLETLILHRLPGENLGMILGIEGGKDDTGKGSHVLVKSVTLGGAAYRATGSNRGVCVSDEILKVNGTDVRTLSHDECISVFKDMPLRVSLGLRRGQKNLPPVEISPNEAEKIDRKFDFPHSANVHSKSLNMNSNSRYNYSDSEEEKMTGFAIYKVRIEKEPYEKLGLSIVPSYGSTKEFYQIKRILPSGAAAHCRQLQVGDRLITCNGHSLKRLTQNHCLNILKSASAKGDVDLEVIRPVDSGNSMEISVTINNNNTQLPGLDNSQLSRFDSNSSTTSFDPSQHSLKSQSYDRHVDVVVTSESEDYLTLSEDEYSRTGRLANISEAKAHEVFSGKGFKLAYQKPFTAIDEISSETDTLTETETETEAKPCEREFAEFSEKEVDVINFNIDSSPYHIPKQISSSENTVKYRTETEELTASITDLDNVIVSSVTKNLQSVQTYLQGPKTDIDSVNTVSSSGSRNIQSSDLDEIRSEGNSDISNSVGSTPVGAAYLHPRQQVPVSEIDNISFGSDTEENQTSTSGENSAERENPYYSDYNKGIIGIEFPENHLYIGDDNNLYQEEDYELSDSEKYFQPVSDSEEESETALPPPAEFSDGNHRGEFEDNHINIISVTNIDDFTDTSSPVHQIVDVIVSEQEQEYPEAELAKLEASLRELDEASSDKPNSVPLDENFEISHDQSLPLNCEVTINNQKVPDHLDLYHNNDQEYFSFDPNTAEYGITVNNKIVPLITDQVNHSPYDYADSKEVLQVVKDSEEDQVIVTQFSSAGRSVSGELLCADNLNNNSTMDYASETMLKNALDMEYDMIPESEKMQTRIILADIGHSGEVDSDDSSALNHNLVAECVAEDMIKSEQANYGYYMESDDEPDNMPDQDQHDEPPDLPDMPPPVLHNITESRASIVTSAPGLDVKLNTSDKKHFDLDDVAQTKLVQSSSDPNWSFRVKDSDAKETVSEQEIYPAKLERKSNVCVQIGALTTNLSASKTDSDIIVPVKVDKKPYLPVKMLDNNGRGEISAPASEIIIEPKATVTVNAVKPKVPPEVPPKPSPRKINENKELGKNVAVVQLQHVDEYADRCPVNEPVVEAMTANRDKGKSVLNVVRIVSALKHEDTVSKRPVSPKDVYLNDATKYIETERQSSPPKKEIIETCKETVQIPKPGVKDMVKIQEIKQEAGRNDKTPVKYTTQIQHDREPKTASFEPNVESHEVKEVSQAQNIDEINKMKVNTNIDTVKVKETVIPRLNLGSLGSSESDSLSPASDKSDTAHEKVSVPDQNIIHRTTVETSKQGTNKKNVSSISNKKEISPLTEVKQLSHIKPLSFNPKSLSKPQPVQYKTTINTLGSKPSGISTLGRSSLLTTQKAEHPIKRMETMPFEVSILKGILGIGIKTKITPEGYVQITEILPSGPVGREGNIKVGDYLLSVNNNELTGLPDGKVQQILRLLPRGLSKIVASAVPPEHDGVKPVQQKTTLSPRASLPFADSHQPALSSSQKSATLPLSRKQVNITSPKQPLVSTKSLPFASKPFGNQSTEAGKHSEEQTESPKSPKSPKLAPALAPRRRERQSATPRSPPVSPRTVDSEQSSPRSADEQPSSPISPRKNDSEKSSPRTPPKVAPKPKRNGHTSESLVKPKEPESKQNTLEESGPIETEIFASITGPKSEYIPSQLTGPTIMPGSVMYDYVSTKDKVDTLPGKVDVVEGNESQSITVRSFEQEASPQHETPIHTEVVEFQPITENKLEPQHETPFHSVTVESTSKAPDQSVQTTTVKNNVRDNELKEAESIISDAEPKLCESNDVSVQETKESSLDEEINDKISSSISPLPVSSKANNTEQLSEQKKNLGTVSGPTETEIIEPDTNNDQKQKETCSDADSKHDLQKSEPAPNSDYHFRAPEHSDDFKEQAEPQKERSASVSSESSYTEFHECSVEDESNLEDITEENDTEASAIDSAIKQKEKSNMQYIEVYKSMAEHIVADVIENVKAMDLSESCSKNPEDSQETKDDLEENYIDYSQFPSNSDESPPPLPDSDAPPLPSSPCPVTDMAFTNDLSKTPSVKEGSQDSSASSPSAFLREVDTGNLLPIESDQNPSVESESIVEDVIEISHTSEVHASVPTIVVSATADSKYDIHDESVVNDDNDVYSQEKLAPDTDEQGTDEYTDDFENESSDNEDFKEALVDTESFHSVQSTLDEIPDDQSINTVISLYADLEKSVVHKTDTNQNIEPAQSEKVNGFSIRSSPKGLKRPDDLKMDTGSEKGDSSFSSDSAMSPARSGTPHSDDDRTEVDRLIRLMSHDQEPQHNGEGEIIQVKMNKGVTGVGFVIQGGKGSPKGDVPISVRRIFKGGPADQCGQLQVNDEILDVNGEDLTGMRHSDAWQHLKFLPSGDVTMTIRRYSS